MIKLLLPFNGNVEFESPYGYRFLNGERVWHNGIDLVGLDSDLIRSPCDGKVLSSTIITDHSNKTWEWGNYIKIHKDNLDIFLCHMQTRYAYVGDEVKEGQIIGVQGNTGYSFGKHCHFEVRENGTTINPCNLLRIPNRYGIYNNEKTIGHDWSQKEIEWCIDNGILKGRTEEGNDYDLESYITREEMCVMLYRLYHLKD